MAIHIPQHTIDATPWLICEKDDAWDFDRIEDERRKFRFGKHEHPFDRYQVAETRYDLEAPFTLPDGEVVTIRDYLHPDNQPARFKIRELNPDEFATVQDLLVRGQSSQAYTYAARVGLTGIDGIEGVEFKKKKGRVDEKLIGLLHRAGVLLEIGSSIYLLSRPLDEAEKK